MQLTTEQAGLVIELATRLNCTLTRDALNHALENMGNVNPRRTYFINLHTNRVRNEVLAMYHYVNESRGRVKQPFTLLELTIADMAATV